MRTLAESDLGRREQEGGRNTRWEGRPQGWGLAGGTQAAPRFGLQDPRAAGDRDPTAQVGRRQGQLLPARGGPRPRWRRWLRLRGSGSASASPSQHPPPRSARAAGPRPERRRRARGRGGGGAPSWAPRQPSGGPLPTAPCGLG